MERGPGVPEVPGPDFLGDHGILEMPCGIYTKMKKLKIYWIDLVFLCISKFFFNDNYINVTCQCCL